jgi:membrane-bound lytic murein transglycosylase B
MSFDRFLADLKQQAVAAGVSQRTIAEASPYLVYDQGIVNRDRGQRVFGQVFTEFAGRMAASYRMQQGQARIKAHVAAFARAEKEYGVPPAVIAAFWGLESDFGANMGSLPTLRSLMSLAYDCRRSQMFADETIAAENHPARRPDARRNGRLVGRRTRPDAVSADALFQLRRRLRRRRTPRSAAQPGRRDRLDRELHPPVA